jgi:hypothetical protein
MVKFVSNKETLLCHSNHRVQKQPKHNKKHNEYVRTETEFYGIPYNALGVKTL